MPIHPPAHPDWMNIPFIGVVLAPIPGEPVLRWAHRFLILAQHGYAEDRPNAIAAVVDGFRFLLEVHIARLNLNNLNQGNQLAANVALLAQQTAQVQIQVQADHVQLLALEQQFNEFREETRTTLNALQASHQKNFNRSQVGYWLPVINPDGIYPAANNLPPISRLEDIDQMERATVIEYLDFYQIVMDPPAQDNVWHLTDLRNELGRFLTSV